MTATTAQQLFNQCAGQIESYPLGTCALADGYPKAVRGFFPVASGSFHNGCIDTPIATRKVMFVGQDWGSEANRKALEDDPNSDIESGTGLILLKLLTEEGIGIQLKDCFFTNALFGVRTETKNTGPSPGWKDTKFVNQCASALRIQIELIQPKAIVCLGRDAPWLLAKLYSECKVWQSPGGFVEIDQCGHSVLRLAARPGPSVAAILLHPSYRKPNEALRSFQGSTCHEAEVKILAAVWEHVIAPTA